MRSSKLFGSYNGKKELEEEEESIYLCACKQQQQRSTSQCGAKYCSADDRQGRARVDLHATKFLDCLLSLCNKEMT
jgi:hypothetical protein